MDFMAVFFSLDCAKSWPMNEMNELIEGIIHILLTRCLLTSQTNLCSYFEILPRRFEKRERNINITCI